MTIALWYLWVEVLGAIGFALAWRVCRALPDRGWCAAKTIGVLLLGLLSWWGYALGLLSNTSAGIALTVFGLAAIALLALTAGNRATARDLVDWVKGHWRFVVGIEMLFALAFVGWCLVRANDPAADHTEEPMDLMLLVAVSNSDSFPPADPWLAGYPISYYYMGYWLLGALGRLVGTPPEITYNLGQATWYGLLLLGVFGLAFDLAAFSTRRGGAQPTASSDARLDPDRVGVRSGLIAALLVCFSANIALPLEWGKRLLQGTGSAWAEATSSLRTLLLGAPASPGSPAAALWGENWWWWRSSRVVQDTQLGGTSPIEVITEFPFFSYLLGDNHPHVLAMPVVVTVLTLAFAWFAAAAAADPSRPRAPRFVESAVAALGLAAVAGSIVAINTWDLPGVWSVVVLAAAAAAAVGSPLTERWRRALLAAIGSAAVLVLGSTLLYLPYHLTASSQVQGILPNFFHPTRLGQLLLMFATLVPGLVLLLLEGWRSSGGARPRLALTWWLTLLGASLVWLVACVVLGRVGLWPELVSQAGGASGLVGAVLSRWGGGWLTLALCTATLALLLETLRARWISMATRADAGVDFALLLAATAVTLIALPELVYLHDSFGNRMNTVFKLWYQAWLLLALAGAVGLAAASRRRGGPRAAAVLGLALIVPGLFYPVASLWSKTGGFGAADPTLDSLAWLQRSHPEELEALRWVRASTATRDVVVQRSGGSYRGEENLPSIVTGRPTLLGWGGHEYQWRGAAFSTYAAGREEALERMYRPPSAEDLELTLRSWNVDYLYVGPQERNRFKITAADESVYGAAMDLAFENPQVRIYRRRG